MSQFRILLEKEIRGLISSTKFVATFGVCALLIIMAFYVGAENYKTGLARYRAAQAETLRQLDGVTDWLEVRQHRIFLPPQPLAALVSGISNDIGRTTDVEARGELAAYGSRFNEEPLFAVFRFLDLSFVFQIVLSLFAILLGYDAVSGEKERGTLRLSMANAVPRTTYIAAKMTGSFAALASSVVIAMGVGCLLLPLLGVHLTGEEWLRLALILLAGLLYFGAFLTASVFVSSLTHRSANAFLVMLTVWIASVLFLPRAAVLLAGRAVDVPSVDQVDAQKAAYGKDLWKEFREGLKDFRAPEGTQGEGFLRVFNDFMDSLTSVRDAKMNEVTERLNEERHNRQLAQQQWAFGLARISPTASLSLATAELAGTSLTLKESYYRDAMAYQQTYAAFMKEKTGMNIGGRMIVIKQVEGEEEEPESIDPQELPGFAPDPPPLKHRISRAVPDLGLLAVFNLLFFAGAFVSFSRYDLR